MKAAQTSAIGRRSGEQRSILAGAAAIFLALVYGLALIALQGHARGISAQASTYLGALREARLDLAKGFLHIVGATASDKPFDANRGHALADQGLAALEDLLRRPPFALPENSAIGLEAAMRQAGRALSGARGAQPLSSLDATSLRIAFFDAERACAQLDALVISLSSRRLDSLEAIFWTAVLSGGALLAGSLIVAGREARRAALAARHLRSSEDRLRLMVRERDTLLKELHHRTKNNMQVISSILSLRASGTDVPAIRETLREISDRVMSMSLVHEKLYASADLSHLDLGEYLRDLGALLARDGPPGQGPIDLRVDAPIAFTTIETAIPVGLAVTELISNSMKHAFRPGLRAAIELSLGKAASGEFTLIYRDSGPGLPEGLDPERSLGLGLKIIVSLIEGQLAGSARFERGAGFHLECRFRELSRDAA